MRLPREITPGAAARRSFLADLLIALALAGSAIILAAGIGIAGFGALLVLIALLFWFGTEAIVVCLRRRHRARASVSEAGDRNRRLDPF